MSPQLIKALTPPLAIMVIAGIELFALSQGIDGTILAGAIAIISGLGGYTLASMPAVKKAVTALKTIVPSKSKSSPPTNKS